MQGPSLYRAGWRSLRNGAPDMNTLISLGTNTAFFYSLVALLTGAGHLYFDSAAMVITIIAAVVNFTVAFPPFYTTCPLLQ